MEYFTETAESHSKAIDKVKAKYGDAARILMHKSVRIPGLFGIFPRDGVEVQGYVQNERPAPAPREKLDLEEEKRKIIAQAKSDQAVQQFQQMAKDIQAIKERIESVPGAAEREKAEHESLRRVGELLDQNDFSAELRDALLSRARKEFSLEDLEDFFKVQDRVLEWIGELIEIYKEPRREPGRPRVMALVGPTGVGKTTTIAKLAATFSVQGNGQRQPRVRIVSIDNYRIGARQQMETYAEIMRVPFSSVETFEDLRKTVDMHREDADVLLVDTIGKSPKDAVKLAEMKEILAACGPEAEPHLAMSAGTKAADMAEIMRQFEPFAYKSVVVTKLDETMHVGNIVSALKERGRSVSFLTTGQRVPVDIERATVMRFLLSLEGFRVDRLAMDKRFPAETQGKMWK
jgi:flagellar biosynthesis protein FlhF